MEGCGSAAPVLDRSRKVPIRADGRGQVNRVERRQEETHKGQFLNVLDEPLLKAEEAAQLLRVPRSTLYELVRSRHLPHVKVGRSLRFTRAHLARWVDQNSFQ